MNEIDASHVELYTISSMAIVSKKLDEEIAIREMEVADLKNSVDSLSSASSANAEFCQFIAKSDEWKNMTLITLGVWDFLLSAILLVHLAGVF